MSSQRFDYDLCTTGRNSIIAGKDDFPIKASSEKKTVISDKSKEQKNYTYLDLTPDGKVIPFVGTIKAIEDAYPKESQKSPSEKKGYLYLDLKPDGKVIRFGGSVKSIKDACPKYLPDGSLNESECHCFD